MEALLIALSGVSPVLAGFLISARLKLNKVNQKVVEQEKLIQSSASAKVEIVVPQNIQYSATGIKLLSDAFGKDCDRAAFPSIGFVYVALLKFDGCQIIYKVGKTSSRDVKSRINRLKSQFKVDVECLISVKTSDCGRLEKQVHRLLFSHKIAQTDTGVDLGNECYLVDLETIREAIIIASTSSGIDIEFVQDI